MLIQLYIQNFVTIKAVDLSLKGGLSILTGTTGAGKSLLLDALSLGLGARVDANPVRPGHDRAQIALTFDITHVPSAQHWLKEYALDQDQQCIIRRTINTDNRSKMSINGVPSTLQQVRELSNFLLGLQAQHQHHDLIQNSQQQTLLDQFCGLFDQKKKMSQIANQYLQSQKALMQWKHIAKQGDAQKTLWTYQLEELRTLDLSMDAIEALYDQQKQLTHSEQLIQTYQQALFQLTESDQSCLSQLQQLSTKLSKFSEIDHHLKDAAELLNQAAIYGQEALVLLQDGEQTLDADPESLARIEAKLTKLYDIARKNQVTIEQLPALSIQLEQQLSELDDAEHQIQTLENLICEHRSSFLAEAMLMSQARQAGAQRLSEEVLIILKKLGMKKAQFQITVLPNPDTPPNPNGIDQIEFLLSANPGQPLQPLSKVASGGEISRISLALQVCCREQHTTPTLIFDEVDAGISGDIASMVGLCLKQLSEQTQVICITHLPQVAAYAEHHFKINKSVINDETHTHIDPLDKQARLQELARLLGGATITSQALANAEVLLLGSD